MLLIKTILRPSTIAGKGLFAASDIPKGTVIWEYTPDSTFLITSKQLEMFVKYNKRRALISQLLNHSYFSEDLNGLVLELDHSRYVNHSDDPNMTDGPTWRTLIALRDIAKGEELTESYHKYLTPPWLEALYQRFNVFVPQ
jgi:uncharacterized protein